jgi:2-succinyl-5-enolpyruvyl-6-hydroxy-3-cyclohexene-1-carboxylate synthase
MSTEAAYQLLHALADEFARCGMTDACTAPGSRSTPLVVSLARERRLRCHSHIDERCAGFFALGLAQVTGRPVAVACTSGTAAAELAPAVIEAHEAGHPLIVLTADRPAELREVGAGQAIDQLKLYGDAAKWFFEVDVHDAGPQRLRWIRTLACRAYWTALQGKPGPVHLNFPLREPLVPPSGLRPPAGGRPGGAPWVEAPPLRLGGGGGGDRLASELAGARRPLIVAGRYGAPGRDTRAGQTVARFAADCGIPLLADPLSGARRGPAAVAHYDTLVREPAFTDRHTPDLVVRVGDLPTCKPLRLWLAGLDQQVRQIGLGPQRRWQDPAGVVQLALAGELEELLPEEPQRAAEPGWLEAWRAADLRAAEAISDALGDELSEPAVAALLARRLPAQATLVVASSMPIRDVESFFAVRDDPPRALSNRGANGIDGTVSTAFGAAAGTSEPVVLLIGDVALAHDIGGLLSARRLGLALTIVLVNNQGGGIFDFLPVSEVVDVFEHHVATPHGLDFEHAARLYGVGYARVSSMTELASQLDQAVGAQTTTLLEVPSDRAANLDLHRRVTRAVADALTEVVRG